MKRSPDSIADSDQDAIADRDFTSTLLDLSGALAMVRDAEGRIVGFNRAAQDASGYSTEELRGKPIWDCLVPPEQRQQARAIFRSVLQGATAKDYENTWIRKDGSRRALLWSSFAHRMPEGSVTRVFSTGLDITGRKQTEDALRASEERYRWLSNVLRLSNAELKRANEDLNQFAYSASHDLQEPLRMVAIYTQMLQRKYQGKLDGEADQYLGFTLQGAKRMEMLVRSLLEYARAMNVPEEEAGATEANAVLEKALENLAVAIKENGAIVTFDQLPSLAVQEVHLLQVFQNLVSNALKYRSQEPPRIHIGAERLNGEGPDNDRHEPEWKLWVRDNGIGLNPKYAERIFGIFKRLHSGDEYPGAGIGLATCKRIVERYGGRIWVESEENHGATFYFTLPAGDRKNATEIS